MSSPLDQLRELADLYGIHNTYYDVTGKLQTASQDALLLVLRALGASLERPEDAQDALRERRQSLWRRALEPVAVIWDGNQGQIEIRHSAGSSGQSLECRLQLESGEERRWAIKPEELPVRGTADIEGTHYLERSLTLPGPLPLGYHRLAVEGLAEPAQTMICAAPMRAYEPTERAHAASWGVFLPLYALHSERSWGAGDFTDLEALNDWVTGLGGGMVATLPLLAAFLDEPFEPGPYSPASRLFWNEFYIDVSRVPELKSCPTALALLASKEFETEVAELRKAEFVNYRKQMALKRRVLNELARSFFARPGGRADAFRSYVNGRPLVDDYAKFRAVGERCRAPWPAWPTPLRDGVVQATDYDQEAYHYHLYVQWIAEQQLQDFAAKTRAKGPGLYLDLPLGVNPDSFDVWRHRDVFAASMAAGAPPDPFFAKGQNWGFPPMHPERIRTQGYGYVIDYVRHHLRLAGILRIDHMMGFHRLFWIPHGLNARDGVYVRYRSEELYAIFNLESHRHRSVLVGEDLGTVPEEVPISMANHNVHRMYVMQYAIQPHYHNALTPVYPGSVASLNTHDMPPFAAFWQGLDIQDRVDLGILDGNAAEEERRRRQGLIEALIRGLREGGHLHENVEPLAVLQACLAHLGAGPSMVALANLEDLWLETHPQNVPGTWHERPNWQRRAAQSFESFTVLPQVVESLRNLEKIVRAKRNE